MKVTKAQATENREAIVHAAAKQLRERGFEQMSVAEVARDSGLTHGALYSHFKSKESLQVEATRWAFEETARAFKGLPMAQFLGLYLSQQHRDTPGAGCPNAALVSDVPRQPAVVQEAFRDGLQRFIAMAEEKLASAGVDGDRDMAITTFATMVGGLALSRAIRAIDRPASDEILRAVTASLGENLGTRSVAVP